MITVTLKDGEAYKGDFIRVVGQLFKLYKGHTIIREFLYSEINFISGKKGD